MEQYFHIALIVSAIFGFLTKLVHHVLKKPPSFTEVIITRAMLYYMVKSTIVDLLNRAMKISNKLAIFILISIGT